MSATSFHRVVRALREEAEDGQLEELCCAALRRARLEDYTDIDTFDRVLKSVMRLVRRERAAARRTP